MDNPTFIQKIRLTNFLSFGPEGMELELGPLNVLIGPNASGKSNFVEAFSILQAAPTDLNTPFNQGGGAREWLWKGPLSNNVAGLEVSAIVFGRELNHTIRFSESVFNRLQLVDEILREPVEGSLYEPDNGKVIYHFNEGYPVYRGEPVDLHPSKSELLTPISQDLASKSILSSKLDTRKYIELTQLSWLYSTIQLYRGWTSGYDFPPRKAQPAFQSGHFLFENAANLAMVLNTIDTHYASSMATIVQYMKYVFPLYQRTTVNFQAGQGTIYFHEEGLREPVPAIRASDGLLRYLCLLTILCHPKPPKIIGIDEPEIGLHPDAIIQLAKVLKDASNRSQLIITTHSDILVSQFTDSPESVVVCDRDESGTHMKRLKSEELGEWLENEYLGDKWLAGEIGGTL